MEEKSAKVVSVFGKKVVVSLDEADSLLKTTICRNELGEGVKEGDSVTVAPRPQTSMWKRWLLYGSPAILLLLGFAVGFALEDPFLQYALLLGMVGLSFLIIFIFKTTVEGLGAAEYVLTTNPSLEERIKFEKEETLRKEEEAKQAAAEAVLEIKAEEVLEETSDEPISEAVEVVAEEEAIVEESATQLEGVSEMSVAEEQIVPTVEEVPQVEEVLAVETNPVVQESGAETLVVEEKSVEIVPESPSEEPVVEELKGE